MSYIWVKNVVVFFNQRAIFPVSEARFKLSLFLFFLLFLLKFERYVVYIFIYLVASHNSRVHLIDNEKSYVLNNHISIMNLSIVKFVRSLFKFY